MGPTASTGSLALKFRLRCRPRGVCAPPGHFLLMLGGDRSSVARGMRAEIADYAQLSRSCPRVAEIAGSQTLPGRQHHVANTKAKRQ
jgi:hypothetical protein